MASRPAMSSRVLNPALAQRAMGAEEAAALIDSGTRIGMSGFTGSGYPKAVPMALARRIADANLRPQHRPDHERCRFSGGRDLRS